MSRFATSRRPPAAAVIASEDATFCNNDGVDWGALREVIAGAGPMSEPSLDHHHADREEPVSVARPVRHPQRH